MTWTGSDTYIGITLDTTEADRKLKQYEENTQEVTTRQIAMLRRGTELGLLTLQAVGATLDQSTRVYAYIIQTGIETLLSVRSAFLTGGVGAALTAFGLGAFQIGLLYSQLNAIESGRADQAAQMQASYSLLKQTGAFLRVFLIGYYILFWILIKLRSIL